MGLDHGASALEVTTAIGTLLVAIFTGWLAWSTWRLAWESRAQADAADKLYALQQADVERRERRARPNLQIVDAHEVQEERKVTSNYPLVIDLRNFGERSALLKSLALRTSEEAFEPIEQGARPVVHPGEILRVKVDRAQDRWSRPSGQSERAAAGP